jgi:hypothetical protein
MSNPLVTYDDYVRITGDSDSSQDEVEAALDDMLAMVQEELDRFLVLGTYTETLPMSPQGSVFPRAVPVSSITASSAPDAAIDDDGYSIRGVATLTFTDSPLGIDDLEISGEASPYGTLTYQGGYTHADFPVKLRRIIARLATVSLNGSGGSNLPPGTTAASVGDTSISLEAGTVGYGELDALIPGTCKSLYGFQRPSY